MRRSGRRQRRLDEFTPVHAQGQVFLIRCRLEPAQGFFRLRHWSWGAMWRTSLDRRRWNVDLNSDRHLFFPILKESFDSEAEARARVDELVLELERGQGQLANQVALGRNYRSSGGG